MRIAQVTCLYPPEHNGGAPQQCRRLALGLSARGHEVAVFDAFAEDDERNWRNPDVEVTFDRFLEEHRPEVVHFHAIQGLGASLLERAEQTGARVVVTMHDLWWVCARLFCVDRQFLPC